MNDFIEWSSTKDPDSIGWSYRDKAKHEGKGVLYFPSEQLNSKLLEWITDNVKKV